MSDLERPVPPVGEEVHLPGPTLQPLLLAVGLSLAIVGVTISAILLVAGLALFLGVLAWWIADARREYAELPAEHAGGH